MEIRVDDPRSEAVAGLLREHLEGVAVHSPSESIHALGVEGLCSFGITFWTAREGDEVLGCGALLELDPTHGEIKSMRTARQHLRIGVASAILQHIIDEAKRRGYTRLSLETGSMEAFAPAWKLYARFGFVFCEPFADYLLDPNTVFMKRSMY
ncbi:MAG: GNAT family N-acetyltransferase [Planctomycetota bacterium]|nr:GNAT family N-acetyltransferase [Planctomycetota bacterium]